MNIDTSHPSELHWHQISETLTLDDLPVLQLELQLPDPTAQGKGGRRISAYYRRLGQVLQRRWRTRQYLLACLDFGGCQQQARPFHPWHCAGTGQMAFWDGEVLDVSLTLSESCGASPAATLSLHDRWQVDSGTPLPLPETHRASFREILKKS